MAGPLVVMNWLLPLAYLALLIDYGATFFLRTKTHVRSTWLLPVIALHGLYLVLRSVHVGHPPLVSNYEVLSVLAWSMTAVYWIVELGSRDRRTGVFVLLLAFLFQYSASAYMGLSASSAPVAEAQSNWARLHVALALVSYTAMAFAGIYGLLNLLSRRNLKHHRLGVLFDRLPSLELLGKMTWQALVVGFVAMTITIAVSAMILQRTTSAEQASVTDPKVASKIIIGSVAWVICGIAFFGRLIGKWPHSRVSRVAVGGFLVILVLIIISAAAS